jgi:hypothetical protein
VSRERDDFAKWRQLTPRQRCQRYWRRRLAEWQKAALVRELAGMPVPPEIAQCLGLPTDDALGRTFGRAPWNQTSWGSTWPQPQSLCDMMARTHAETALPRSFGLSGLFEPKLPHNAAREDR